MSKFYLNDASQTHAGGNTYLTNEPHEHPTPTTKLTVVEGENFKITGFLHLESIELNCSQLRSFSAVQCVNLSRVRLTACAPGFELTITNCPNCEFTGSVVGAKSLQRVTFDSRVQQLSLLQFFNSLDLQPSARMPMFYNFKSLAPSQALFLKTYSVAFYARSAAATVNNSTAANNNDNDNTNSNNNSSSNNNNNRNSNSSNSNLNINNNNESRWNVLRYIAIILMPLACYYLSVLAVVVGSTFWLIFLLFLPDPSTNTRLVKIEQAVVDLQEVANNKQIGDELRERVKQFFVDPRTLKENWSDISGLRDVRDAVKSAFEVPVQLKHFYRGKLKPYKSLLLYGAPGTGKTLFARVLAKTNNSPFMAVPISEVVSKFMGDGSRTIEAIFVIAREAAKRTKKTAIVFFDEVDAFAPPRDGGAGDSAEMARIVTTFLTCMDGVRQNDDVFVFGATNFPNRLDSAMLRRFNKQILVPLPIESDCKSLLRKLLADDPYDISDTELQQLAHIACGRGLTPAAIDRAVVDLLTDRVMAVNNAQTFSPIAWFHPETKQWCDDLYVPDGNGQTNARDIDSSKKIAHPVLYRELHEKLRVARGQAAAHQALITWQNNQQLVQ